MYVHTYILYIYYGFPVHTVHTFVLYVVQLVDNVGTYIIIRLVCSSGKYRDQG